MRCTGPGEAGAGAAERYERAVGELLRRPSHRTVDAVASAHLELCRRADRAGREAALRTLRSAQAELREAGDAVKDATIGLEPVPAAELGRCRRALERYQAAEADLTRRFDAAEGPSPRFLRPCRGSRARRVARRPLCRRRCYRSGHWVELEPRSTCAAPP